MSYIVGTSLPRGKTVVSSLPYIYGIGHHQARILCRKLGLGFDCRFEEIDRSQIKSLENEIESSSVIWGQDLKRFQKERISRLYSILAYRGLRHRRGLPVRGQRTHTNAKRRPLFK